jgi:hypothetical protein
MNTFYRVKWVNSATGCAGVQDCESRRSAYLVAAGRPEEDCARVFLVKVVSYKARSEDFEAALRYILNEAECIESVHRAAQLALERWRAL